MTTPHPTHLRCIEPHAVCEPTMVQLDSDPTLLRSARQLYMVIGKAVNAAVIENHVHLFGEFEAIVLGVPGGFRSRQCRLFEDRTSQVIIDHIRQCPYDVGLIFMVRPFQVKDYQVYPVIRLLSMQG